jgi:N-acetylneuraminic acid mutarotase
MKTKIRTPLDDVFGSGKAWLLISVMVFLSVLAGAMVCWGDDFTISSPVSQTKEELHTWRRLPDMPHKAADCTAVAIDDKIIVFGGYHPTADTPLNYTQIYNVTTGTWSEGTPMPTARWGLIAATDGKRAFVFGGSKVGHDFTIKKLEIYDPDTDNWSTGTCSPVCCYAACAEYYEPTNKIYLIGGRCDSSVLDTCIAYNITTDSYDTSLTNMPDKAAWCMSGLVGEKIYLMTGDYRDDCRSYNITDDSWNTSVKDFPSGGLHGAGRSDAVVNGKVYLTHGLDSGFSNWLWRLTKLYPFTLIRKIPLEKSFHNWLWEYDPANDTWTRMADNLYAADGAAVCTHNGYIYTAGGRNTDPATTGLDDFTRYYVANLSDNIVQGDSSVMSS